METAMITEALVDICRQVLARPDLTQDDDFIAMGGDSLSAAICLSRIWHRYKIEIPIDEFLVEPAGV